MKYIIFVIVITLIMSFSASLLAKTEHALISSVAQTDASGKKAKKEVNSLENNTTNNQQKAKEGRKAKKAADNKAKTKIVSNNL